MPVALFANILSHSVGWVVCIAYAFFCCEKVLTLIKSHFLFLFSLGYEWLKKKSCCGLCQRVFPLFSSKSFIVSGIIFRSLIYFEFIFVYGVRKCSNFILLHVAAQISQYNLLKRHSFLHCTFLPPLS